MWDRSFGLLHEDLGGVVGIHKGLMLKLPVAHVAVHPRVHGERLHVSIEFAHLLDLPVEISDEGVASALHEPQLEVAVPWQQVLIGRSAALEVSVAEEGKFYAFLVERGDGYVE